MPKKYIVRAYYEAYDKWSVEADSEKEAIEKVERMLREQTGAPEEEGVLCDDYTDIEAHEV